MPKHEFGIMDQNPVTGQRFDQYEPQRYHCIAVDDDIILPLLERLTDFSFYWHTTDVLGNGLAYCGITLLSPEMSRNVENVIRNIPELYPLSNLLKQAIRDQKFVIHFGI